MHVTKPDAIVSNPAIRGGEPVLAGTATTVRAIVEYTRLGDSPERIVERLPHLTVEQIVVALDYYGSHREVIDNYLVMNHAPEAWAGKRVELSTGEVLHPSTGKVVGRVASLS